MSSKANATRAPSDVIQDQLRRGNLIQGRRVQNQVMMLRARPRVAGQCLTICHRTDIRQVEELTSLQEVECGHSHQTLTPGGEARGCEYVDRLRLATEELRSEVAGRNNQLLLCGRLFKLSD